VQVLAGFIFRLMGEKYYNPIPARMKTTAEAARQ